MSLEISLVQFYIYLLTTVNCIVMYDLNFYDIFLSSLRWLIGLSIGSLLGIILALITQIKVLRNNRLRILIDFLRAIPLIGLIPVVQINIGINEYGKIGIIVWAVTFVVWITVKNSMEKTLPNCELMLKAAKSSKRTYLKIFTIPKIINGFFKGIELSIGTAWLCVVAAEWVGTFSDGFWAGGMGFKLTTGYELTNWQNVYLSLFCFGILGLMTSFIWRLFISRIFSYNKRFNPTINVINLEN